jgi:hypothetical protein
MQIMQQLYTKHGPNGTLSDGLMVFSIEADPNTDSADLHSPYDYTTDSYPVFDLDASNINVANDYQLPGYPTIYMICPDKKTYFIGAWNYPDTFITYINHQCSWGFDAEVSVNNNSGNITCSNPYFPNVNLYNNGDSNLLSCTLKYQVDNGPFLSTNWNGNLSPGSSAQIVLPNQSVTPSGVHQVFTRLENPNGIADQNPIDDLDTSYFLMELNTPQTPNISETFAGGYPPPNWINYNPGNGTTWRQITGVGGFGQSNECINMDFYNQHEYGIDYTNEIYLPPLDLSSQPSAAITFDIACAKSINSFNCDTLQILASTDCGLSWSAIYEINTGTFFTSTVSPFTFVPIATEWAWQSVNISQFQGQTLLIKFRSKPGGYGEMYLDNINVTTNIGIGENTNPSIKIFPNPSNGNFQLIGNFPDKTELHIFNLLGEEVNMPIEISKGNGSISVQINLTEGIYVCRIMVEGELLSESRLVIIQ